MRYLVGVIVTAVSTVSAVSIAGCQQTTYPPRYPDGGGYVNPTGPSNPAPPSTVYDVVEYRVTGTPASVIVRYSNSQDGLVQVTTSLPFVISFRSNQPSVFLSLDALPVQTNFNSLYPFMAVQIFVNGNLFREASSANIGALVSVNGTWRR